MWSGLSIYLVWFSRELWSLCRILVWDQLETCSFLPCRFSLFWNTQLSGQSLLIIPWNNITLYPIPAFSLNATTALQETYRGQHCLQFGAEKQVQRGKVICQLFPVFFQRSGFCFLCPESPGGIYQPCGILGLNLMEFLGLRLRIVNLIIPLGKSSFSMSKFKNHLARKWPLSLQRPNLHLRMAALSPSPGKGWKDGCVITVIEQLLRKVTSISAILGQVTHILHGVASSALNSCVDDLDTQQGWGTVVLWLSWKQAGIFLTGCSQ